MEALSDIIDLWPSVEAFAQDAGVSISLVRVWKSRRSIPADRWAHIEAGASKRDIKGATASVMARLASAPAAQPQAGEHV